MEGDSPHADQIIDIDALFANGRESGPSQSERSITIPKIPKTLTNILNFPKWIEPNMISIGPYYHGLSNLQEGEKMKPLWAKKFLGYSKQEPKILYNKIKSDIAGLRSCYDKEKVYYDDERLTTMFLLDGCALLHLIRCFGSISQEDGLIDSNFTNHHVANIQQDLFLLENQIPFEVLNIILNDNAFKESDLMKERIKVFITSMTTMARGKSGTKIDFGESQPFHLLDLLRDVLVGKMQRIGKQEKEVITESVPEIDEKEQRQGQGGFRQFMNRGILGDLIRTSNKEHDQISLCHFYRNVQELKAVGIHFKPSKTGLLKDISFTSYFGITGCLRLPSITIDTSTMIIFLNLIAQESSSNRNDQFSVISYLCFLDSLIDNWEDVKELQAARVLHNFVGDKKEVAQFFNHVCGQLIPDLNIYKDVRQQIQKHVEGHHSSKLLTWFTQCKNTYFSSPWSVIALVGALLGLFLTAVQTYISVYSPSKT